MTLPDVFLPEITTLSVTFNIEGVKEMVERRLEGLQRRIRGAAHCLAWSCGADPQDVESEIVLAILARYAKEPAFLDQRDTYVVGFGVWRARDALRRERARYYGFTVEDEPGGDPGGPSLLDALGTDPWEAVDRRIDLKAALDGLTEENRAIANALAAGFVPREIGPALGLSRRTVYNRIVQIRRAWAGLGLSAYDPNAI
jgi:DNA-directed RNA polymerase specialized sigma24 family protein